MLFSVVKRLKKSLFNNLAKIFAKIRKLLMGLKSRYPTTSVAYRMASIVDNSLKKNTLLSID